MKSEITYEKPNTLSIKIADNTYKVTFNQDYTVTIEFEDLVTMNLTHDELEFIYVAQKAMDNSGPNIDYTEFHLESGVFVEIRKRDYIEIYISPDSTDMDIALSRIELTMIYDINCLRVMNRKDDVPKNNRTKKAPLQLPDRI